jgi:glutaredoxin
MNDVCTVYWQPGCTSCLAVKEFLRTRDIPFESVNVREDPLALERLASLGVRSVPVIARGSRYVLGQDLDELARFVGVSLERNRLSQAVLAARLLALLDRAAVLTRRIPLATTSTALPGRKRTHLELAYHLPQVMVAFLDAAAGGRLTYEHFNREMPEGLQDPAAVAELTERAARSFAQWWAANHSLLPAVLDTYYGQQSLHSVLERTTTHVAQHLRQLALVLGRTAADATDVRLDPALLAGLPLPEDAWDAEVPLT